jgi:outer membrane protein OmpA-like peptidoglycan-associated protein
MRLSCASAGLAIALLFMGIGCAETVRVRGGIDAARVRLEKIEADGAYNCAPRELALAQAQLEFAELEIAQGVGSRARHHFAIAMTNLNLADKKTVRDQCLRTELPKMHLPMPEGCFDRDGDHICDEVDRCPDAAEDYDGIQDEDGCPEDQDTDGDGIPDSLDMCILDPEDKDGFEDSDGCPEDDNDLDGIPDALDKCPDAPEDFDGYQDDDGCPEDDNDGDGVKDLDDHCPLTPGDIESAGCPKPKYEGVEVTESHIRINQQIFFAYNKATIKKESFHILSVVAQVLNDNPEITLSIEGHTDSRGNARYNKKLSANRAKAVLEYLVKNGGIARHRLRSVGYGKDRPIDTNLTEEGRALNRRVEFVRTDVPPQ